MDYEDDESGFSCVFPPALVSLTPFKNFPFSLAPRRLSSCFTQPSKPLRAKRQLAWLSPQGWLDGATEATSSKTINRTGAFSLSVEEASDWELFTPAQLVLVVAIVAAAAANSNKNRQILKLQKAVEIRDQILLSMQQKLDNLCDQVSYSKDQPKLVVANDPSVPRKAHHHNLPTNDVLDTPTGNGSKEDEIFKYKDSLASMAEPEERRMSDLSDWAPSVASSFDIQLESLAEQDMVGLQKEFEEKEVTIKKSYFLQSSKASGSKRVAELENIVRRKNMIINKLQKDILILEQKVINLTRMRRPSFSAKSPRSKALPLMADNVLYDMDNTSSSDPDSPPRSKGHVPEFESRAASMGQLKSSKSTGRHQRPSALKERSLNQTPNSLKVKYASTSTSDQNRMRGRPPTRPKENQNTVPKRWA